MKYKSFVLCNPKTSRCRIEEIWYEYFGEHSVYEKSKGRHSVVALFVPTNGYSSSSPPMGTLLPLHQWVLYFLSDEHCSGCRIRLCVRCVCNLEYATRYLVFPWRWLDFQPANKYDLPIRSFRQSQPILFFMFTRFRRTVKSLSLKSIAEFRWIRRILTENSVANRFSLEDKIFPEITVHWK